MNSRPVRTIIESPDGIVVVFDDTGEQLRLTGCITARTNDWGNPNDFVVRGTTKDNDFRIPPLMPGEILWDLCTNCGFDHLATNFPEVCDCGGTEYERLGTQQAKFWRQHKFGNNYRRRTVK